MPNLFSSQHMSPLNPFYGTQPDSGMVTFHGPSVPDENVNPLHTPSPSTLLEHTSSEQNEQLFDALDDDFLHVLDPPNNDKSISPSHGPLIDADNDAADPEPMLKELHDLSQVLDLNLDLFDEEGELEAPTQAPELPPPDNGPINFDYDLSTLNASQAIYNELVTHLSMCFPEFNIYSLYCVTKQLDSLSGTATMVHNMCPNSCIAFTGPYADLDKCPMPRCGSSHWDPIKLAKGEKVPAKTFSTIVLGPQLQALFGNPESAHAMQYHQKKTQEVVENACQTDGEIVVDTFDDIYSRSEYLWLVNEGKIDDNSILLSLSIDSTQLYEHKVSDCWIYIYVILDLDSSQQYKKCYVLPGSFIPGPKKPKNLDSFLFPGLHHLSALQKEGLRVWDASKKVVVSKNPLLVFKTADAPGMVLISRGVGHSCAKGCRRFCEVLSHLKPGGSHFYPILLKPEGSSDANQHDTDLNKHSPYFSQEKYNRNLIKLLQTRLNAQYEETGRETGLSKPSIFTGLIHHAFGIPGGFPIDTMHLFSLNITDFSLMVPSNMNPTTTRNHGTG
ncbi:hypothetical protein NP233_g10329 [Leucocoprinus birnbaumii]|uniref:Uncharacterized protein n=1 Tax=Leucocoprinus birnbaumii TaxID=56174 RepID=A0AAD5VIS1_9AGAR|nr:hypothetical protein NP233_g10329 [Leucocoprinus birnbaumii]